MRRMKIINRLGAVGPQALPQPTIALLQSHSLASLAQREIERRILAGEIAPGGRLNEAELAQQLGVSRGPIREAFRMLEEAGLVSQQKNRGAFVRAPSAQEIREIFELRVLLEEAALRKLAQAASAAQLRHLRALLEQMDRAAREAQTDAYHALNIAFHEALIDFADNAKLAAIYRRLVNELALCRRRNLEDPGQLSLSVSEHRAIVKAIAAGDAEACAQALRAHTRRSRDQALLGDASEAASPAGRRIQGVARTPTPAASRPMQHPAQPPNRRTRHA